MFCIILLSDSNVQAVRITLNKLVAFEKYSTDLQKQFEGGVTEDDASMEMKMDKHHLTFKYLVNNESPVNIKTRSLTFGCFQFSNETRADVL